MFARLSISHRFDPPDGFSYIKYDDIERQERIGAWRKLELALEMMNTTAEIRKDRMDDFDYNQYPVGASPIAAKIISVTRGRGSIHRVLSVLNNEPDAGYYHMRRVIPGHSDLLGYRYLIVNSLDRFGNYGRGEIESFLGCSVEIFIRENIRGVLTRFGINKLLHEINETNRRRGPHDFIRDETMGLVINHPAMEQIFESCRVVADEIVDICGNEIQEPILGIDTDLVIADIVLELKFQKDSSAHAGIQAFHYACRRPHNGYLRFIAVDISKGVINCYAVDSTDMDRYISLIKRFPHIF